MASGAVEISHPERVIFPEAGYTKGDLAEYYAALAPLMLPFLAGRPLSLVRCPQGRQKKCFFQKHDTGGFGPAVHTIPIEEKGGKEASYLSVGDSAGILVCVQMGTIEFHSWASRCDRIELPDRMVFDLDPGEGVDFAEVRRAAFDVRERLRQSGLASFALLTGGKGVHVIAPLAPGHGWDAHRGFAKAIAGELAAADPGRFTATMGKAGRKGRTFIDWLRNTRGATAIAPYSARARPGAPIAAPVAWDELESFAGADALTIGDAARLVERAQGAALKGWGEARQKLPES